MLSFFKSNNPGVVVFYLLYLALFRLCILLYPIDTLPVFNHYEPLAQFTFGFLSKVHATGSITLMILSALLCFIQALLINLLVNENKILSRKNYLPGLIYIIACSFFKESLVLSPALIALTFVILATLRIFSLIKKEKAFGDIFDVSFLVAIASLFYFPCILFFAFAVVGLATMRPFVAKEWVVLLSGFFTPFFLAFTWYFWHNEAALLIPHILNLHHQKWMTGAGINHVDMVVLAGIMVVSLAAMAVLPAALYSSLIQVRKFSTVLVFLVVLTAISFSLQQITSLSHWILLALPLSVLFSMALMQIRNKLIAEVLHLMLILLVLIGQYLPLLNII